MVIVANDSFQSKDILTQINGGFVTIISFSFLIMYWDGVRKEGKN